MLYTLKWDLDCSQKQLPIKVKPATFSALTLILKILLLPRKGHLGQKLEKRVAIFLIFALMLLGFKKAISYHLIY